MGLALADSQPEPEAQRGDMEEGGQGFYPGGQDGGQGFYPGGQDGGQGFYPGGQDGGQGFNPGENTYAPLSPGQQGCAMKNVLQILQ